MILYLSSLTIIYSGIYEDWWDKTTKKAFHTKKQCIIGNIALTDEPELRIIHINTDQYGNYTVRVKGEVLHVNGTLTQGENIADNAAMKYAIRAYNRMVEAKGEEPLLPGLPYTQRQLFWLSGAAVWCSVKRPASLKYQILTDPHSPER